MTGDAALIENRRDILGKRWDGFGLFRRGRGAGHGEDSASDENLDFSHHSLLWAQAPSRHRSRTGVTPLQVGVEKGEDSSRRRRVMETSTVAT